MNDTLSALRIAFLLVAVLFATAIFSPTNSKPVPANKAVTAPVEEPERPPRCECGRG